MTDVTWDAGAVSDHGADAGAEHQAPGVLKPPAKTDDAGADHGAEGAGDSGAGGDFGADSSAEIKVHDSGADKGADGVAGELNYGSSEA